MSFERITLQLSLTVTYDVPSDALAAGITSDLEDNLLALPWLAMREGLLTIDTEAEVVVADPAVKRP